MLSRRVEGGELLLCQRGLRLVRVEVRELLSVTVIHPESELQRERVSYRRERVKGKHRAMKV